MTNTNLEALLAEMREETQALRAHTASEKLTRDDAKKAAQGDIESSANSRRSGEQGRNWRTIQQRIDLGQTTLSEVMNGVDLTAEAAAIRADIETKLPGMQQEFEQFMAESENRHELAGLHDAQKRLADTVERLRTLNLEN